MQHFFRTSFTVLGLALLVVARFTVAQTAQFTINGIPTSRENLSTKETPNV